MRHISVIKNCMPSLCACPILLYKKLAPSLPTLVFSFHPHSKAVSVYPSRINLSRGLLRGVRGSLCIPLSPKSLLWTVAWLGFGVPWLQAAHAPFPPGNTSMHTTTCALSHGFLAPERGELNILIEPVFETANYLSPVGS